MAAFYTVNGITIDSDFPLLRATPTATEGRADITLRRRERPVIATEDGLQPIFRGTHRLPSGEPMCTVYRRPEGDVVRVGTDRLEYLLADDRVEYCVIDPHAEVALEILFGNVVLSLWAERRGHIALHASAVAVHDVCVAFSATSQAGKSSLAASFVQAGHEFVTDDILNVVECDGVILAQPGAPHMRMWPDLVKRFVGTPESFARVVPNTTKRIVPIGPEGWGRAVSGPLPFAVLYLPRREAAMCPVTVQPLPAPKALVALSRASFISALAPVLADQQPARLSLLARLVRQAVVCELRYPTGYEHLAAVQDAVRAHVASLHTTPVSV